MGFYSPRIMLWFAVTSVSLSSLSFLFALADGNSIALCSTSGHHDCQDARVICLDSLQELQLSSIPKDTNHIQFKHDVHCDSSIKDLFLWARQHGVTVEGKCASPTCLAGQQLCGVNENLNCDQHHIRKRRNVVVDKESNATSAKPSGPGGLPVLPCDFEYGYCQWYQLSDSDFTWTRNKGKTPSYDTGPDSDHTTGNGYYIYIETSLPRKLNDKARLVSPTLRPVDNNQICNLTFWVHMYGSHIGKLNIYQAPVIGHDVIKKSLTVPQGNFWVREQVTFDSDREFQIIIEGVRGAFYRGDIAIDDVSLTSGCQRLEPAYVRLDSQNGTRFNTGSVEVFYNETWGRVCNSGWTGANSNVTCKELGYKSANRSYGSPMDSHVMRGFGNIACSGSEKTIRDCSKARWSNTTTCANNQTASLQCAGIAPVCPLKTHFYCPKKVNETAKCISNAQRCDYVNDCWDGYDEMNCGNYTRCDFESPNLCGWLQALNDHLNWTRHRGTLKDHNGDSSKYYMFANIGQRLRSEKGKIAVTPRFQGNHDGLCKVRFFYHMNGWTTGTLRVLVNDIYNIHTVWKKVGSHGNQWIRAEVTLINTTRSFQVMFEAEHTGGYVGGDIAIDDVSFTPECRPATHENITCKEGTFKCTSGECVSLEDRCDYKMDCFDGFDELNCGFQQPGRCNFERGFCDWKNETDDVFDFERSSRETPSFGTGPAYDHTLGYGKNGYFAYIEASTPRKRGDSARLAGPQFMWKGIKGCKIRFFYNMWSIQNNYFVGTLKALLRNAITRETKTLWQRTGSQGNKWNLADVPIATNWSVSQIVLEASVGYSYQSDIAIDDISFTPQCYPEIPAHIDKTYDVRLVGKKSSYEGRVEVFRVGYWGTVCTDGWDKHDAQVVCKQLGYSSAVDVHLNTIPGKGQIWLDNLKCFGNESNLSMCGHNGWSVHNCNHDKDAMALCDISTAGATVPLRLTGYQNDSFRGVAEVYKGGVWGSVCIDEWDLHDAHVACRQAGFLGIERVTNESKHSTSKIWLSKVSCQGNEDSLGKCSHAGWGAVSSCNYGYAGVVCKQRGASEGDVRLVGGRSVKEGRVEIFHRGEWGTVCEDRWGLPDAQVVCFELGFTGVLSSHQSFGPGTGRVWLNNVQCNGTESSLSTCPRSYWGNNPCTHNEDIGIICGDNAYVGCYIDNEPRVMPHKMSMSALTPVKCLGYCRNKGYSYIGLEWGTECYCGNHYNKYGNTSESKCNTPCNGDKTKICGGPKKLSVYATNPAILPSAAPGWMPVRQSCSSVTYYQNYAILNPISSPNYFSGDHKTGYIWSPLYPANYPNKIHCVWVLSLQPGTKARIQFESFNIEDDYDTFEARDGKRQYSTRLTPYRGFSGTRAWTLTASSNTMWLKFYADETVNEKGFKIRYDAMGEPTTTVRPITTPLVTTVDPSSLPNIQKVIGGCNGQLHSVNVTFGYYDHDHNTGYLKSPGFGNNNKCNWTITVQTGFVISIRITHLDLGLSGDVLAIGDGYTTQKSIDHSLPWSFTSRDNLIHVSFVSAVSRRKKRNSGSGFFMKYERVHPTSTEPSFYTTLEPSFYTTLEPSFYTTASPTEVADKSGKDKLNHNDNGSGGMGGGTIALIVICALLIPLVVVLVIFLLKNKKKRANQNAHHCFTNQAYDNTDGMPMGNTGPTAPQGLQDASIFYANVAVAPPPYTPQADSGPAPEYASPTLPTDSHYSSLYSHPPPYRPTSADPHVTTTGIGSVTNLRDAPPNESGLPGGGAVLTRPVTVLPSVDAQAGSDDLPFAVKSVLPPIGVAGAEEKTPLPENQAGPLPEKLPIEVASAYNNVEQPPTRLNPLGPLDGRVARSQASLEFDVEVPFEFICPISNKIMKHPVSASDGYTYERRAIKSWFRQNHSSPMTNEKLTDLSLRSNENLEIRIKQFVAAHSKA